MIHFSYNQSTSSDRSSPGYSNSGKRQHQSNISPASTGETSSVSTVKRGDFRRQSQIINDENCGAGVSNKKSGNFLVHELEADTLSNISQAKLMYLIRNYILTTFLFQMLNPYLIVKQRKKKKIVKKIL